MRRIRALGWFGLMIVRTRAAGGGYTGWMALESAQARRRRAAARRQRAHDERP
jgi:hypothetical protein